MTGKTAAQLEARRAKLAERLRDERAKLAEAERELTAALVEDRSSRTKAPDVEALRVRAAALARAVDELGPAIDEARRRETARERAKRVKEARRVHETLLDHARRVDGALRTLEAEWLRYRETERLLRARLAEAGLRPPAARPVAQTTQRALFAGAPRLSTDLGLPRVFAHKGSALEVMARPLMPGAGAGAGVDEAEDDPLELPEPTTAKG